MIIVNFVWMCLLTLGQLVVVCGSDGGRGQGVVVWKSNQVKQLRTTVWHRGYVITAKHVVAQANAVDVYFPGTVAPLKSTAAKLGEDVQYDIALLDVYIPHSVPAITVGDAPAAGDALVLNVLNRVDVDLSKEFPGILATKSQAAAPTTEEQLYADCELQAGFSGGAVLDNDSNLVGIVSGGWFWFGQDSNATKTWPLRATSSGPIRRLIERHRKQ